MYLCICISCARDYKPVRDRLHANASFTSTSDKPRSYDSWVRDLEPPRATSPGDAPNAIATTWHGTHARCQRSKPLYPDVMVLTHCLGNKQSVCVCVCARKQLYFHICFCVMTLVDTCMCLWLLVVSFPIAPTHKYDFLRCNMPG